MWTIAAAILRDPSGADDMVQEAAVIALNKLGEFDPASSFAAWFGQIVRFTSMNESRKRRKASGVGMDVEVAGAAPAVGVGGFDAGLRDALEALDEVPRTCLLMRTLHQMSFAEISAALSIPEGTAMSHVHRARAAMRERLSRSGGAS
mgnify:CR=1 FL=1